MKTCFECEAEVLDDAEFCHKCGRRVTGKHSHATSSSQSRQGPDPEILAKGRGEHAAIRSDILAKARLKARKALTFLATACFILAIFWVQDTGSNGFYYGLGMFFSLMVTSLFMGRDRWLTQAEYYSITGSRDRDGEHRCVFCRNKGIYWQGEYAGNTKYAQCSKCKEPLFFH